MVMIEVYTSIDIPYYETQSIWDYSEIAKGNYWNEYIKCCSTWAVSYFLNVIILEIMLRLVKNIFVSQFVSLGLVSISTYVLFKFFAFKK